MFKKKHDPIIGQIPTITVPQPKPHGLRHGFGSYTPAQLIHLKEALALRMSPQALHFCAGHYRIRENDRAPMVEELLFLDAVASAPIDSCRYTLSELYTNDPFVADTYADMMNKRRELHPEAGVPVSLGEALCMASAYLSRSGKPHGFRDISLSFCSSNEMTEDAVGNECGTLFLRAQKGAALQPEAGDVFLLLHRDQLPMHKYHVAVKKLMETLSSQCPLKLNCSVPANGLYTITGSHVGGLHFDLRSLAVEGVTVTPNLLFGQFEGYRVISIPKAHLPMAAELAAKLGIACKCYAERINSDRTVVTFGEGLTVVLDPALLNRLQAPFAAKAMLPDESAAECDPIFHLPASTDACSYLASGNISERVRLSTGLMLSSAVCYTQGSFFRSSLETALHSLLALACTGVDYTEARLAVSILHPTPAENARALGETVASILGIYRFQCELGIPAALTAMQESSKHPHPVISVFSLTKEATVPSSFSQIGSKVYCVAPARTADGLPDFEALRQLLRELARLHAEGAIRSAKILSRESITDAMEHMSCEGLTCRLSDPEAIVGDTLPLAILLESDRPLPFQCIGEVAQTAFLSDEAQQITLPTLQKTLNAGETYEITVVAQTNDGAASTLIAYLESKGAQCTRLAPSSAPSELCRSILLSQLTLLGSGVTLPRHPSVTFALETQKNANGAVISFGDRGTIPESIPVYTFENGIKPDLLSQIFK